VTAVRCILLIGLGACTFEPPVPRDPQAGAAFAADVSVERVMADVERLSSEHAADAKLSCAGYEVEDRYPACDLSRDAAVAMALERFAALGLTPRDVMLGEPPEVAHNVIAELPGTTRPGEVVLIGAHLDAFYSGADDNSSGVAAMFELARIATQHRFARTLRFAGFDLEERGSAGSLRYVQAGLADDVTLALILECIGFADHEQGSQDSPPGLPLGDAGDTLFVVGDHSAAEQVQRVVALNHELDLIALRGLVAGGDSFFPLTAALTRSDNGPLWLHGVPALMFTDTANFRNPDYHREGDTPDTLDPAFLGAATRMLAASVAELAELQP
jgi:Zn-dependent M28 family amino/carboxypeptidase